MTVGRSSFKAAWRALAMIGNTLFFLARQFPTSIKATGLPAHITRKWHVNMCKIGGIEVSVIGEPQRNGRTFFVSNHISYIDILAIGSVIDGCFIAKSEVESWPIFGWLSKQRRTLFVERSSKQAKDQGQWLKTRLMNGDNLILFPEGTSSNGVDVLPFKSTLFAAVEKLTPEDDVIIQPITIAYSRYNDQPMCARVRVRYAWYDKMTLGAHLWYWLGMKRVGIDLMFHEPIVASSYPSRKDLANHCHQIILKGLQNIAPVS